MEGWDAPFRRTPRDGRPSNYQDRRNGMVKDKGMGSLITEAIENKAEEENKLKFDEDDMFGTHE